VSDYDTDIWLEDFVSGLLDRTGLKLWIEELDVDERTRTITLQLDGPDKARAIGRDGQVLEAIQHLAVAAAANAGVARERIIIDVDGYRQRRDERLKEDALRMAEEALETGEALSFEPMPPRERRLVHLAVADIAGITTESRGEGEDRYVRLVPSDR
jgi:spoIIIJ-associated protein